MIYFAGVRCVGVMALIMVVSSVWTSNTRPAELPPSQEIFKWVERFGPIREVGIQEYANQRIYRVLKSDGCPRAETRVRMSFGKSTGKKFTVVSRQGSGWVHRFVFQRLLDAETETSAGKEKQDSSITTKNYTFTPAGTDVIRGHPCWVFDAKPRVSAKYLFVGRVYINKTDYGIVRMDGSPAKSLSFWVKQAHIIRDYEKVGPFWMPLRDHTETQIRIFGSHVLDILYDEYRIKHNELDLPGLEPSHYQAGEVGGFAVSVRQEK